MTRADTKTSNIYISVFYKLPLLHVKVFYNTDSQFHVVDLQDCDIVGNKEIQRFKLYWIHIEVQ